MVSGDEGQRSQPSADRGKAKVDVSRFSSGPALVRPSEELGEVAGREMVLHIRG
jgi:hypothetical protein